MKSYLKKAALVVLGVFVLYTFYFLWKQAQPAPIVYELVTPVKTDIRQTVVSTGKLESRTQVDLTSRVTGQVAKILVKVGQTVKPGDVVAVINIIPDMAQLNQAQGSVETARIKLAEVKREFDRSAALYAKGVIAREEYDQIESRLEQSRADLMTAQYQVEVITKGSSSRSGKIRTTEVISNMHGTILSIPVKLGTAVSGSSLFSQGTTVCTVADMSDVIYHGNVDESDVAKLNNGMQLVLDLGSMKNTKLMATLDFISPIGVTKNGANMFEVKATVNVPRDLEIRSGYSVNASIVTKEARNAICIDETALNFSGDSAYVYMLTSNPEDTTAQEFTKVPVSVGISDGLKVEITKGVTTAMRLRGIKK